MLTPQSTNTPDPRVTLGKSALQLLREIHNAAASGCHWRDAREIGAHQVSCVAIGVQRCQGMALQASIEMEARVALGRAA